MIIPIVAYGDPVLRKEALFISDVYPELSGLIKNMFDTMYNASGVGLAAPQIGVSIKLFIVDASPFSQDDEFDEEGDEGELPEDKISNTEKDFLKTFKKVFINPVIIKEDGTPWKFNEGCLSIPKIREDVLRKPEVHIKYMDENFIEKEEKLVGLAARIVQHEYDHIMGKLFIDHLNPMRKKMLKGKLDNISRGLVDVSYKMKFPKKK